MSSIRINLSMALITLVILISALEIQHGVLANEQVSNLFFFVLQTLFCSCTFWVYHAYFERWAKRCTFWMMSKTMHILNDEQNHFLDWNDFFFILNLLNGTRDTCTVRLRWNSDEFYMIIKMRLLNVNTSIYCELRAKNLIARMFWTMQISILYRQRDKNIHRNLKLLWFTALLSIRIIIYISTGSCLPNE